MKQMPKVSIILPSLNVEPYIRACLQTVVSQTLKEIEIICVDAGSTDGTLQIIEEFAQEDSRIRILHSDYKSYGYQVNLGMDAATGEYMGIVETDDIIALNMYERLYQFAVLQNVDIVKADFCRFTIHDGVMKKEPDHIAKPELYGMVLRHERDLDKLICGASLYTWAGIYRLSFLRDNGIRHNETPGASYQDNGFWFQTMSTADRVAFLNESFYMLRRDNPNSSINSKGKVYCVRDEYEFILQYLRSKPNLYEHAIQLYWWARFGAYRYSYRRIAPEFKEEFLKHFRDVFLPLWNTPVLNRELFSKKSWDDLRRIIENPAQYNNWGMKEAQRSSLPKTPWNRLKWCYEDNGLIYTLKHILKRVAGKLGLLKNRQKLEALTKSVQQLNALTQAQAKQLHQQQIQINKLMEKLAVDASQSETP